VESSFSRFTGVAVAGLLLLSMILGSIGLANIDPDLVFIRPTRIAQIPTSTLYPTLIPGTATPQQDIPLTETTSPTPPSTATPASSLIEQCTPPLNWLPHVVKEGETFVTLAWKAGTTVYLLMQANCLGDPKVEPGDVVYLPPAIVISPTAMPLCGPPLDWKLTLINPGETLFTLAKRYGTTVNKIRLANCMLGTDIYAGKRLYLPPVMVITPTRTPYLTAIPTFLPSPTATWIAPTPTPRPTNTPAPTPTGTIITPSATPITPTLPTTPTPGTPTPTPGTLTPTPTTTPDIVLSPTPSDAPTTTTATNTPIPTSTATQTPATVIASPTWTSTPVPPSPTPTELTTYPPTATKESE